MQRLRLKFNRKENLKFLSHLDIMRLWERAFRRANLYLSYSEGFTPHPKISIAVPLPVGITAQAELMDVWLQRWFSPDFISKQIKKQLPEGIDVVEINLISLEAPSLQSTIRFAEYILDVESNKEAEEVSNAIRLLLDANELSWHHLRNTEERYYDLRVLIDDIWLISNTDGMYIIGMRLRCDSTGTGRPEQVIKALGFDLPPKHIHRTKLIFSAC